MASDVLCLCIMLAGADLFLGFSTSFELVYALAPPARSTSTSATLPIATTPTAAASELQLTHEDKKNENKEVAVNDFLPSEDAYEAIQHSMDQG
ncbi:soluble inorganic pyrophosphatase-like isoform X2 [Triticum dicoccoides]|uniref:soluble inorganic pyrophosphatase-like isoform X2 n=1 Tax=Triticum dicoccoides TaxID=85692 RepID=UPI00188EE091|nr:soluble inorganic pyrophosphatase-like isoform X2 [Triticum dicoccoides]